VVLVPKDPSWGRDQGKALLLTEMPAAKAEKWAMRMFLALKGSESQIPLEVKSLGMVGVAIIGMNIILRSTVKFEDLEPLLDEMIDCIQAIPDHSNVTTARKLLPGEIEEVSTLAWLRSEILELHTGFSVADALSKLISEVLTATKSLTT
jgi:hypothetical protein